MSQQGDWLSVSGILRKQSWLEGLDACRTDCTQLKTFTLAALENPDGVVHAVVAPLQLLLNSFSTLASVFETLYEGHNGKELIEQSLPHWESFFAGIEVLLAKLTADPAKLRNDDAAEELRRDIGALMWSLDYARHVASIERSHADLQFLFSKTKLIVWWVEKATATSVPGYPALAFAVPYFDVATAAASVSPALQALWIPHLTPAHVSIYRMADSLGSGRFPASMTLRTPPRAPRVDMHPLLKRLCYSYERVLHLPSMLMAIKWLVYEQSQMARETLFADCLEDLLCAVPLETLRTTVVASPLETILSQENHVLRCLHVMGACMGESIAVPPVLVEWLALALVHQLAAEEFQWTLFGAISVFVGDRGSTDFMHVISNEGHSKIVYGALTKNDRFDIALDSLAIFVMNSNAPGVAAHGAKIVNRAVRVLLTAHIMRASTKDEVAAVFSNESVLSSLRAIVHFHQTQFSSPSRIRVDKVAELFALARHILGLDGAPPAVVEQIGLFIKSSVFVNVEEFLPFHPALMKKVMERWGQPGWSKACFACFAAMGLTRCGDATPPENTVAVCMDALQQFSYSRDAVLGVLTALDTALRPEAALRQFFASPEYVSQLGAFTPDHNLSAALLSSTILLESVCGAHLVPIGGTAQMIPRLNLTPEATVNFAPIVFQQVRRAPKPDPLLFDVLRFLADSTFQLFRSGHCYNFSQWDLCRHAADVVHNSAGAEDWHPVFVETCAYIVAVALNIRPLRSEEEFTKVTGYTLEELQALPADHAAHAYDSFAETLNPDAWFRPMSRFTWIDTTVVREGTLMELLDQVSHNRLGDLNALSVFDSTLLSFNEANTAREQAISFCRTFHRELHFWAMHDDLVNVNGLASFHLLDGSGGSAFPVVLSLARFSTALRKCGKRARAATAAAMGLETADALLDHCVQQYATLRGVKVVPLPWVVDCAIAVEASASLYRAVAESLPGEDRDESLFRARSAVSAVERALGWLGELRVTGDVTGIIAGLSAQRHSHHLFCCAIEGRLSDLAAAFAEVACAAFEFGFSFQQRATRVDTDASVLLQDLVAIMRHVTAMRDILDLFERAGDMDARHAALRTFLMVLNVLCLSLMSRTQNAGRDEVPMEMSSLHVVFACLIRHKMAVSCALLSVCGTLPVDARGFVAIVNAMEKRTRALPWAMGEIKEMRPQRMRDIIRNSASSPMALEYRERLRGQFTPFTNATYTREQWPRVPAAVSMSALVKVGIIDVSCDDAYGLVSVRLTFPKRAAIASVVMDVQSLDAESVVVPSHHPAERLEIGAPATDSVVLCAPLVKMSDLACGSQGNSVGIVELVVVHQSGRREVVYDCFAFSRAGAPAAESTVKSDAVPVAVQ